MKARSLPSTRPFPAPHKLDLYQLAVQQPWVTVNLLMNMHASLNPGRWPVRLREDFSGSAALAMAWAEHDHDHHALAIDNHGPTVKFAQRKLKQLPAEVRDRLTLHHADVLEVLSPSADITAVLNFSINIYHSRQELLTYLRHARKCLARGGILVCDTYGGPGAWQVGKQKRRIKPYDRKDIPAFDYIWEQRDVDPLTGLVDCRIHFRFRQGKPMDNAFVYHWRLWSIPELIDAMREAGFGQVEVWSQDEEGSWGPTERIGPCEAFVAYVMGQK